MYESRLRDIVSHLHLRHVFTAFEWDPVPTSIYTVKMGLKRDLKM